VAIYLENARLLEETRRRLREGNVLLEFSRRVSGLEIPSILQAVVDESRNAIPEAEGAMVALWEPERPRLPFARCRIRQCPFSPPDGLRRRRGAARAGLFRRQAGALGACRHGLRLQSNALEPRGLPQRNDGADPGIGLGRAVAGRRPAAGIVLLENFTAPEAFSRSTEEVALSLANQTALALEKARLFEEMTDRTHELDERASHLALLNRLTNAAITTSNERTLLQIACRELAAAFGVTQSAAALIEAGRSDAAVVAEYIYPGRPSAMV